jgi:glucans biosynthesis protein C
LTSRKVESSDKNFTIMFGSFSNTITMLSSNIRSSSEFRRVFLFWIGAYVILVLSNLAMSVVGGHFPELVTGSILFALVVWHYVISPWRENKNRQKRRSADDVHHRKSDNMAPPDVVLEDASATNDSFAKEDEPTEDTTCSSHNNDSDSEETSKANQVDMDNEVGTPIVLRADPSSENIELATPVAPLGTSPTTNITSNPRSNNLGSRMAFLDNVKVFLTFLVVTHHITCGFGGSRDDAFFLVVGMQDHPTVQGILRNFTTLNQSFFMPLFFFVSAYFVPTSYERKGPDVFRNDKRHRLLIPALITCWTISPACMILQSVMRDNYDEIMFFFAPGHTWFLFWLLILNWMYTSFYQGMMKGTSRHQTVQIMSFPSTLTRMAWGATACGILMWVVTFFANGNIMFALMPLHFGALTCDIFMFAMGILAKRHNWLLTTARASPSNEVTTTKTTTITIASKTSSLATQMDINPWWLRLIVVFEAAALIALVELYRWLEHVTPEENDIGVPYLSPLGVPFYVVSGLFCVDMGLALVQLFQQYANKQNAFTQFLSKAAYGVFLIHPVVVVGAQAAYILAHNAIVGEEDRIFFDDESRASQGGGDFLPVGWIIVNVISHLIVWPLAWLLSQAPYLRTML